MLVRENKKSRDPTNGDEASDTMENTDSGGV